MTGPSLSDFALLQRGLRTLWSAFSGLAAIVGFLQVVGPGAGTLGSAMPLHERLGIVTQLGVVMAFVQAVAWSLVERAAGWKYGAGADAELPQGGSAVALASTVVLPLLVVPPMYAWAFGLPIVPAGHYLATAAGAVGAALGHLAVYGVAVLGFDGLRRTVMGSVPGHELFKELGLLFIYSFCIVMPIVVPYRIVTGGFSAVGGLATLKNVFIPPLTVFLGGATFILVRYPDSIQERSWVQVRGVVVGFLVMAMIAAAVFL